MKLHKSLGFVVAALIVLAPSTLTLPVATPALAVTGTTVVAPTSGSSQGGTAVTITGTGFQPGTCTLADITPVTTATFDIGGTPTPATSVVVVSITTITAITGAHAPGGPVTITVSQGVPANSCTPASTSVTSAPLYTYISPATTSINPASGQTTGGTPITITGVNLNNTNSVTIDGVPATSLVINAAGTSVTATTGAHPVAGTFVVCLDNTADANPATCGPITFTYVAPTSTPMPSPIPTVAPPIVPTPIGGVAVTGTVVGVAPAGFRSPATSPLGAHLVPNAHVVLVDLTSGTAFGTHTTFTGTFSVSAPPGIYRLSIADNDDDSGQTDCAQTAGSPCGHLIFQQIVSVAAGGLGVGTLVLSHATVPGALPTFPGALIGLFGEARDATSGNPLAGAVVTVAQGTTTRSTTTGADGRWSVADSSFLSGTPAASTLVSPIGTCAARELADLCADTITPSAGWNNAGAFLVVGPVIGPPPIIPGPGFSLELNGTTAYAEAPHDVELNLTGDWTIEAWFKDENPSFDHPRARILSKGDTAGAEVPYFVAIEAEELIAGFRTQGTPQLVRFNLKNNKVTAGAWHHVAATLHASTHELSLYLDGVRVARGTVSGAGGGNSSPLSIGRSGAASGHYWRGKIDDVRIWNVTRTADEIQGHLLPELLGAPIGLVGNWKFDDGTGPLAADSALPPQNAALQGGAAFSTDTPSLIPPPTPPGINVGGADCVEGSHCIFTVTRAGGTGTANVSYKTENGTATGGTSCTTAGVDFISAAGTVSITPDSSASIAVATCVDATVDASETFNVVLTNTTQGTIFDKSGLGTITESAVCIVRDQFGNCIQFGSPPGTGPICIQFDPFGNCTQFSTPPGPTCLQFDALGNCISFGPPPGTICLQFNSLGQCILIGPPPPGTCLQRDVFGNCIDFGSPPGNCPAGFVWNGVQCIFTGTSPGPGVSINDNSSCAEPVSGTTPCTFTVTTSFTSSDPIAGTYTTSNGSAIGGSSCTAGVDFITTTGTWTIPAFSATASIQPTVSICGGDGAESAAETFFVTIAVTSGTSSLVRPVATGTIPANST